MRSFVCVWERIKNMHIYTWGCARAYMRVFELIPKPVNVWSSTHVIHAYFDLTNVFFGDNMILPLETVSRVTVNATDLWSRRQVAAQVASDLQEVASNTSSEETTSTTTAFILATSLCIPQWDTWEQSSSNTKTLHSMFVFLWRAKKSSFSDISSTFKTHFRSR